MSPSIALAILGCCIVGGLICIILQGKRIMTTQAQLAIALAAISAQLEKASAELVTEIQTLTDAVGNAGGTTPEVDASLARLQAIAQKLDDMNPDVPPAGDTGSGDTAGGDANPGPGTSTGDGSDTSGGTPTP